MQNVSTSRGRYLTAIAWLDRRCDRIVPAQIAELLCLPRRTVNVLLKDLARNRLITRARDGSVQLTRTGRQAAQRALERRQLLERTFREIIGMPWDLARDEAVRLESVISTALENHLRNRFPKKAVLIELKDRISNTGRIVGEHPERGMVRKTSRSGAK